VNGYATSLLVPQTLKNTKHNFWDIPNDNKTDRNLKNRTTDKYHTNQQRILSVNKKEHQTGYQKKTPTNNESNTNNFSEYGNQLPEKFFWRSW
jgi:hypothetical protein